MDFLAASWSMWVVLVPWLVGLVLAARRWGRGRWARLATAGFALLVLDGLLGIAQAGWLLTNRESLDSSPGVAVLITITVIVMIIRLTGLALVVAAVFTARRRDR